MDRGETWFQTDGQGLPELNVLEIDEVYLTPKRDAAGHYRESKESQPVVPTRTTLLPHAAEFRISAQEQVRSLQVSVNNGIQAAKTLREDLAASQREVGRLRDFLMTFHVGKPIELPDAVDDAIMVIGQLRRPINEREQAFVQALKEAHAFVHGLNEELEKAKGLLRWYVNVYGTKTEIGARSAEFIGRE